MNEAASARLLFYPGISASAVTRVASGLAPSVFSALGQPHSTSKVVSVSRCAVALGCLLVCLYPPTSKGWERASAWQGVNRAPPPRLPFLQTEAADFGQAETQQLPERQKQKPPSSPARLEGLTAAALSLFLFRAETVFSPEKSLASRSSVLRRAAGWHRT